MSDTHSRTRYTVPDGDILIHAGDLSSWGRIEQLEPTAFWLTSLPHAKKIIVAGNHDFCLDRNCVYENDTAALEDYQRARSLFLGSSANDAGIVYLENETAHITMPQGKIWKIFGSPSSPVFGTGAFQYWKGRPAEEIWKPVPKDTEILITHTPAYGVLDLTRRNKLAGCESLLECIAKLKGLRLHVFGHIHEAAGHLALTSINDEAIAVNAATPHETLPIYVIDLRN